MRHDDDVLEQTLPPSADLENRIAGYLDKLKDQTSDCLEVRSFNLLLEDEVPPVLVPRAF